MARFMQMGTTDIWFVTGLTTPAAPKVSEITNVSNGTNLTPQTSDLSGFSFDNTPIDTPDMSTALVTKIPGEDAIADSSITFYEDTATNPIKTKLAKGTSGHIVIFPTGAHTAAPADGVPTIGDVVDVWPVQVSSNARQYAAGANASKYLVKFAPTGAPFIAVTFVA